ncbi:hypothetical protein MSPP1_003670 [Malassezia sp. CBS 17886]|nr:hypothetical protein MSPP1_003670 [Malassezia sp. CBS 17886]
MSERAAGPGLRRLPPYWCVVCMGVLTDRFEYTTRAKVRWVGRQILEVFTTEFRDRTKEYYTWAIHSVTPKYRIQDSDLIVNKVHRHEPAVTDSPVRILHRDDERGRIVVVKPGSIPVHATGRFHRQTLVEMVKEQAGVANLYPSNRLDRLTSGIMVCSTTSDAARELGNDFNAGLVNKAYVCRVDGRFPDGTVDCQEPILAVDRQSGLNIVHARGKDCRTLFERLSYDARTDTSVLICRPITGRTHQIRVHAQWLGHPISNDPIYNHDVWRTVDTNVLATAQPRHYERVGGETGNVEVERVLAALKGSRDDSEGWARWRDEVLFGTLNRQMGYDDVPVPGANAMPAQAPPREEQEHTLGTPLCGTCRIPLLPDPAPHELYIYLHAIKYWTDSWVFEDELPWWAAAPCADGARRLPALPLIQHHGGVGQCSVGKGGARRRVPSVMDARQRLGSYGIVAAGGVGRGWEAEGGPRRGAGAAGARADADACAEQGRADDPRAATCAHPVGAPVVLEVPRGLEDAAQEDVLLRLVSVLHLVQSPWNALAVAQYAEGRLPVVLAAYYAMHAAVVPAPLLDALFADRIEALAHKRKGPLLSETQLLAFIAEQWEMGRVGRDTALAAWTTRSDAHTAAPGATGPQRTFAVAVDRSSYILPTLSTAQLEECIARLVAPWLSAQGGAPWTLGKRAEAAAVIKVMFAPRLDVVETLESGPRARNGNPRGTMLFQLQVPAVPGDRMHAVISADATRVAMARTRAAAIGALLPIPAPGDCALVLGTHGAGAAYLSAALAEHADARGLPASVSVGLRCAGTLQGAVVEMAERDRNAPHALLFDVYVEEVRGVYAALAPNARAVLITCEPRMLMRALRELENECRRQEAEYTLTVEAFAWDAAALQSIAALEDRSARADADEESKLRNGTRSFFFHHTYLVQVGNAGQLLLVLFWMANGALAALQRTKDVGDDVSEGPTAQRHISVDQFQEQQRIADYITVAALTLYAWEYLATLPRELYMYQPRMIVRPQVILFLLIRYGTIPAIVLPSYSLWHYFGPNESCPPHEQLTVAVVQFLVACIFSWRTVAIWRRERVVTIFLVVFTMCLFGTSVGLLYFSDDALLPDGACRPISFSGEGEDSVNTVQWFYLSSMIFDTTTLVLSSYKLMQYANMGRRISVHPAHTDRALHASPPTSRGPVFRDPFAAHRQQSEKDALPLPSQTRGGRRRSSATELARRVQANVVPVATFPYHLARDVYQWWSTLTPLIARLIANGFVYFFVATAFNLLNFILEVVQSLHSKSFLTLYPPLMCVLCQRMLLKEFDAVWAPHDPDLEFPGRNLVTRVVHGGDQRGRPSEMDRFQELISTLEERSASTQDAMRTRRSSAPPLEKHYAEGPLGEREHSAFSCSARPVAAQPPFAAGRSRLC